MASEDSSERKRRKETHSTQSEPAGDTEGKEEVNDETPVNKEHDTNNTNTNSKTATEAQIDENPGKPTKRKRKRKRKSKAASTDEASQKENEETVKKFASLEHTVYVEGIPFECTEDQVNEFFVSHGIDDVLQLRLPRWQDTGRLRGYGHVVFQSESSRSKALNEVNGKNLKTRYITIKEAKTPKPDTSMGASLVRQPRSQPQGCTTVFCKNLPYDADEEDIHQEFCVCGKIVEGGIRVARNYQTKQSKGFCYVEYKNPEGAQAAVQKASKPFGICVKGRPCFVDYEEQKMKGSFKTKDGRLWSREFKRNIHTETRR